MASWLLFVVMTTSFLIPEHGCSTFCFSCTDLQGSGTCQHAIKCGEGEICYTQKYKNRNDETLYSLGCTYPELCRKDSVGSIFGRSTEHSHVLCHKCCNSSVCNSELECNDNFKAPPITCLSCGGVNNPLSCQNTTTCGQDEICYMHKYKTNIDNTLYDLGCKHSSACLNKNHHSPQIVGKRTNTETHLTCESCCSDDSLCNRDLNCSHTNLKNVNESCSTSSECSSNLLCKLGTCVCPTTDYYWKRNTCLIYKTVGQTCDMTLECSYPLECIDQVCKCYKGQYWNSTHCQQRKTISEKCQISVECMETLYCNHGECKCDRIDYWTGKICSTRKSRNEACLTDDECQEFSQCLDHKCACLQSNSHCQPTGQSTNQPNPTSQSTKPLECADIDFNNDGLYFIYPSSSHSVQVNCVIRDGIKWTVFQRRVDGSVNFNRTWNEYKYGFGNRTGEFWLGNDVLYLISSNGQHKLRVEMTKGGQKYYAVYSQFLVESESNKYRLTATGYHGDAGDSLNNQDALSKHSGMEFSTRDWDNDRWSGHNCGALNGAGWWYSGCAAAV